MSKYAVNLSFNTRIITSEVTIDDIWEIFSSYGLEQVEENPELVIIFTDMNSVIEAYKSTHQKHIKKHTIIQLELTDSQMKYLNKVTREEKKKEKQEKLNKLTKDKNHISKEDQNFKKLTQKKNKVKNVSNGDRKQERTDDYVVEEEYEYEEVEYIDGVEEYGYEEDYEIEGEEYEIEYEYEYEYEYVDVGTKREELEGKIQEKGDQTLNEQKKKDQEGNYSLDRIKNDAFVGRCKDHRHYKDDRESTKRNKDYSTKYEKSSDRNKENRDDIKDKKRNQCDLQLPNNKRDENKANENIELRTKNAAQIGTSGNPTLTIKSSQEDQSIADFPIEAMPEGKNWKIMLEQFCFERNKPRPFFIKMQNPLNKMWTCKVVTFKSEYVAGGEFTFKMQALQMSAQVAYNKLVAHENRLAQQNFEIQGRNKRKQ